MMTKEQGCQESSNEQSITRIHGEESISDTQVELSTVLSKISKVVTIKDEEFIKSNDFLPSGFWDRNGFDDVTIDQAFLDAVGF